MSSAVSKYNARAQADVRIIRHDAIFAVNGKETAQDMKKELSKDGTVELRLIRPTRKRLQLNKHQIGRIGMSLVVQEHVDTCVLVQKIQDRGAVADHNSKVAPSDQAVACKMKAQEGRAWTDQMIL